MPELVVGVDAGHGGKNLGATVPPQTGLWEKDLTLQVALRVAEAKVRGLRLFPIRNADFGQTFAERRRVADRENANFVVSIHFDSLYANSKAHGLCAYYPKGDSVAKAVGSAIVNFAPTQLMGGRIICAHDDQSRSDDNWLERPQNVVEAFSTGCVLIECGYLTNSKDRAFVFSPRAFDLIAWSIIMGIQRYAIIMGA